MVARSSWYLGMAQTWGTYWTHKSHPGSLVNHLEQAPYGSVQIYTWKPQSPKIPWFKTSPTPNKRKTRMTLGWLGGWLGVSWCIHHFQIHIRPLGETPAVRAQQQLHGWAQASGMGQRCSPQAAWWARNGEMEADTHQECKAFPWETKGNQGLSISFHIYEACHRLVTMNQKRTKYGSCLGYIWIPDVGNVEIHMADLTSPALLGILFAQASSNPKSCSGWFGAMSTSWSVAIRGLIESTWWCSKCIFIFKHALQIWFMLSIQ